jgi:uncharacterized membrane protein YsdA (DUF1294 family)/cold shock CspA family protein
MRHQGKITDWKDDRGFGFVTPRGGGPTVFVHITSFANRQRRPAGNELVTYDLTSDARGRPQATNVAFVGDRQSYSTTAPGPGFGALTFASIFFLFVVGTVVTGRIPFVVLIAYLIMSAVAYLSYMYDKNAALKGQRRTPENTLQLLSLLGGWPGAMMAQATLRHKTQKQSFQVKYWIMVVLNCAVLGLVAFFV